VGSKDVAAPVEVAAGGEIAPAPEKKKRGRPKGSKNKKMEDGSAPAVKKSKKATSS
jgi:hypothetical protein